MTTRESNLLEKISSDRRQGRIYKLAPASIGWDRQAAVAVDEAQMAATAVISTPTPDRAQDVLVPQGCQLENYRKNPVVLWEHGLDFSLPIARAEDPTGKLALRVEAGSITATAYFTNRLKESEQIFALIAERIIRATSVRAIPLQSRFVAAEQGEVLVIDRWELEEWSWVAVPCNPDAVAGVLEKNCLAGSPIAEPIFKSLQQWLPKRQPQVRGAVLPESAGIGGNRIKTAGAELLKKEVPKKEVEDASESDLRSSGTPAEANKIQKEQEHPLAGLVTAAHDALAGLVDELPELFPLLEDAGALADLNAFIDQVETGLALLEGIESSLTEEGRGEAEPETGRRVAASVRRLRTAGWKSRLKTLAKGENLTRFQRRTLQLALGELDTLTKGETAFPPPSVSSPDQAWRAELDTLRATFNRIATTIDEARPHRGSRT